MAIINSKWSIGSDIPTPLMAFSSARKLRYGDKNSFTVRRSSDQATSTLKYKNDYTTDAAAIAAFLNGSDGFVSHLYDQIGSYDLENDVAAEQPEYLASGIDGKPSFEFNDQKLEYEGINKQTPATLFFVFNNTAPVAQTRLFGTKIGSLETNNFSIRLNTDGTYQVVIRDNADIVQTTAAKPCSGSNLLFSVVTDGIDKLWVYKNGVLELNYPAVYVNGFLSLITDFHIGQANSNFKISDVVVFESKLSDYHRKVVEQDIMDFYGI